MNTGQWRVAVLLILLLGLEVLRSTPVQAFFQTLLSQNVQGQTSGG
jgi:hypothetical protein